MDEARDGEVGGLFSSDDAANVLKRMSEHLKGGEGNSRKRQKVEDEGVSTSIDENENQSESELNQEYIKAYLNSDGRRINSHPIQSRSANNNANENGNESSRSPEIEMDHRILVSSSTVVPRIESRNLQDLPSISEQLPRISRNHEMSRSSSANPSIASNPQFSSHRAMGPPTKKGGFISMGESSNHHNTSSTGSRSNHSISPERIEEKERGRSQVKHRFLSSLQLGASVERLTRSSPDPEFQWNSRRRAFSNEPRSFRENSTSFVQPGLFTPGRQAQVPPTSLVERAFLSVLETNYQNLLVRRDQLDDEVERMEVILKMVGNGDWEKVLGMVGRSEKVKVEGEREGLRSEEELMKLDQSSQVEEEEMKGKELSSVYTRDYAEDRVQVLQSQPQPQLQRHLTDDSSNRLQDRTDGSRQLNGQESEIATHQSIVSQEIEGSSERQRSDGRASIWSDKIHPEPDRIERNPSWQSGKVEGKKKSRERRGSGDWDWDWERAYGNARLETPGDWSGYAKPVWDT